MKQLAAVLWSLAFMKGSAGTVPEANRKETKSTSPFGAVVDGLRCRVVAPREIEQGMALDAALEFEVDRKSPPARANRFNTFLIAEYMTLSLKEKTTGKELSVRPYDPTHGMMALDTGNDTLALDGGPVKPIPVRFPLLTVRDSLEPGEYDCRVQFSFPGPKWWRGSKTALQKAAFWKGTVETGVFRLTVRKETPRERAFHVPKQLRLEKGLQVRFNKEDAERVTLPVRNGHFIGAMFYHGEVMYGVSGVPIPGDVNPIAHWLDYKGGDRKANYTIEIFETAVPPGHFWQHKGAGFKVIWRRTFTLELTETEIRQRE